MLTIASIGSLILVALGAMALPIGVVGAIGAVGVLAVGIRSRAWAAVRVAALTLLLALAGFLGIPFALWLVVALLWLGSRYWSPLGPAGGWFPRGTAPPWVLWFAGATVLGTATALSLWAMSDPVHGDATLTLADSARRAPFALVLLAALVFVTVNPIVEEIAYRQIVFTAARTALPVALAVVAQAVAFGALHVAGFPSGGVGVVLATGFGLALGIIRAATGGLVVAVIVHIAANTIIATLVLWFLVYGAG